VAWSAVEGEKGASGGRPINKKKKHTHLHTPTHTHTNTHTDRHTPRTQRTDTQRRHDGECGARRGDTPTPRPIFFFSSRRRHTRFKCDWSSDVCSSDLTHTHTHTHKHTHTHTQHTI